MRSFLAICRKEILHIKRDPMILFFCLVVPCVQLIIFGFAFDYDVRHLAGCCVDNSKTKESREFLKKLENTNYINIVKIYPSRQEAVKTLDSAQCKLVVIIPPDFARDPRAEILVDGSDAEVSSRIMGALRIGTSEYTQTDNNKSTIPKMHVKLLYNPGGKTSLYTIPGLIGIILQLVTVVLTAFSLVKEKEQGTMEQVMVSPISPISIMLGKIVPYAVLAMIEMQIVLYVAWLIFNIQIQGSWLELQIMTLPFILATLALGLLASAIANNQSQALIMVLMVMLPSILLSGFIYPIDNLPVPLYLISQMVPVTHYMQILRGCIIRGASMWDLWQQSLVLWGMSVVLVTASVAKFKKSVD